MRTKRKHRESLMVTCKACGRPFPLPGETADISTHQCPSCGETAEYTSEDMVSADR